MVTFACGRKGRGVKSGSADEVSACQGCVRSLSPFRSRCPWRAKEPAGNLPEGKSHFFLDYARLFWQKYLHNGGVAQLGERLNGIQEAKSSILFISTRNFKELWHKAITPFFIFLSCCASFVPVFIRKRRNFFCRFLGYRALPTELHPRFFIQEKKK